MHWHLLTKGSIEGEQLIDHYKHVAIDVRFSVPNSSRAQLTNWSVNNIEASNLRPGLSGPH